MRSQDDVNTGQANPSTPIGFPRYFPIAGVWVNSYQIFLTVGLCAGILTTATAADASGLSPLPVGLAAMISSVAGLIGARMYHVLVHAPAYLKANSLKVLWQQASGGLGVFGALFTFVPVSFVAAAMVDIPARVLWDQMAVGVLAGGFWIRLGCVFNGCCAGRETGRPFGVVLYDTRAVRKRRIPVQFLEMAWWLIGLVAFLILWPKTLPAGTPALAVLTWYGVGRFFLEPLRERPAVICGGVRINQLMAALIALGAGSAMILLIVRS